MQKLQLDEIAIQYVMLNESILLEDRIQYLKDNIKGLDTSHDQNAQHKTTNDIVDHFATHADPSKNKQHTQFILGLYKNKSIRQEDAPRIREALTNFDKYKNKLSPEDKQLNTKAYPTLSSVEDKIYPHLGTVVSKNAAQSELNQPGHELKYEDDHIKVFKLTSKEASQNLYGGGHQRGGMGTSWCTAARSDNCMFDHYSKADKPLHVVHRKSDGAVFQYHTSSNQFMDAKDNEISSEDFASIAPHLHKAWEQKPELLD